MTNDEVRSRAGVKSIVEKVEETRMRCMVIL